MMRTNGAVVIATVVFALLLAWCPAAVAQTVVLNPTTVEFDPSPDHALNGLDGAPLVTRYQLEMFLEGAVLPFSVQDLGKPSPGPDGKIRIVNASWFVALAMNVRYVAKVLTIGPTGVGVSDPSNPFGRTGPPRPVSGLVVR